MTMTSLSRMGLAAVALAGLMAPSMDAGAAPGGLTCEIRMVKRGGDVALTGIVHAGKATHGTYRFKISQHGPGGDADINQGGDFSLAAGESEVVGEATLGSARGLKARLSVETPNGATSCTRSGYDL